MRRPIAMLLALLALVCGLAVAAPGRPAAAAAPPRIVVERADPLMTEPIRLEVAVLADDGEALPFRGTAVLSSGATRVSAALAAARGETALGRVSTAGLRPGAATLRVRVTAAGRALTATLARFVDVPPSLVVSGFSCTAIPAAGGSLRWAVDRLDGVPIRTPASRDVALLPYVRSSGTRWLMTDAAGAPLSTSGTVVVRRAGRAVATIALPKAVRRLLFTSAWNGRVGGAFRPGAYTAQLTLRDAAGRVATAVQPVAVVARGAAPCAH